jgi:hypothetical protein
MIEGTLEYINHQRDSMLDDEWLSYLEALRGAIDRLIEAEKFENEVALQLFNNAPPTGDSGQ